MRRAGLTFLLLVLSMGYSWACECISELTETLEQKVDIASVIFYGEVVAIADIEQANTKYQNLKSGYEPQFRIIQVLKGDFGTELKGDRFSYQSSISICSDLFLVGKKYLVLANRDKQGRVMFRICNPPFVIEDQKTYRAKRKEIKKALRQKGL